MTGNQVQAIMDPRQAKKFKHPSDDPALNSSLSSHDMMIKSDLAKGQGIFNDFASTQQDQKQY